MTARCVHRVLTPPRSRGAIAVIGLFADDGPALDDALTRIGTGRLTVGQARLRDLCGVDHGVVARWTEMRADLMPHGGPLVVRRLSEALSGAGYPLAQAVPDARALFPEASGFVEAAMLASLAEAPSRLAVDRLLTEPARWAAAGFGGTRQPDDSIESESLADGAVLSRLIVPPLVVAFGRPNIGKSTLLNRLASRSVALVMDAPGTTRDAVGALIDLGGLVVRFLDLPGVTDRPVDGLDAAAIGAAMRAGAVADLVLDCRDPVRLAAGRPAGWDPAAGWLPVLLRSDLGPGPASAGGDPVERVCAVEPDDDAAGVTGLVRTVRDRLVPAAVLADPRPWRFWDAD